MKKKAIVTTLIIILLLCVGGVAWFIGSGNKLPDMVNNDVVATEAPTPKPTTAPTPEPTASPTKDADTPIEEEDADVADDDAVITYAVFLESVGAERLKVIKEYRDFTGLGLADAKNTIDSAPVAILITADEAEANSLYEILAAIGSTVRVEALDEAEAETIKKPQIGNLYYVFMESMGDDEDSVMEAFDNFFGMSGTDVESYELKEWTPFTIWTTDNEDKANELAKVMQDAGANITITIWENAVLPPKEVIPYDESEIATFTIKNSKLDPKLNIMFGGKMLYGSIADGDKVYVIFEDDSEMELTIRCTYCIDERVESVQAGDVSAFMFKERIPSDKEELAIKIVKRTEE